MKKIPSRDILNACSVMLELVVDVISREVVKIAVEIVFMLSNLVARKIELSLTVLKDYNILKNLLLIDQMIGSYEVSYELLE